MDTFSHNVRVSSIAGERGLAVNIPCKPSLYADDAQLTVCDRRTKHAICVYIHEKASDTAGAGAS